MNKTSIDDNCYHPDQAVQAFEALTDTEKRNLKRVASLFSGRGNIASPDELISEAYIRIASGHRRWTRSSSFVQFLAGIIRSLASDAMFLPDSRKVASLKGGYSVVDQDEIDAVSDVSGDEDIRKKHLIEEIYEQLGAHFAGDIEMELLLMGVEDGLRGQELQDTIGVDAKRLEALRTRLNRQIDKIAATHRAKEGQSDD